MARKSLTLIALLSGAFLFSACTGVLEISQDDPEVTETGDPEVDGPELTPFSTSIPVGSTVEVFNVSVGLNCRTGAGTGYMVVTSLPRGTQGQVIAKNSGGTWYKLSIVGKQCWSYHYYLKKVGGSIPGQQLPSAGCHKGSLFGWEYCSTSCPCDEGQGDCDTDAECKSGLVCAKDVGSKYGVGSTVDVCQKPAGSTPSQPAPTPPPASNPNGFSGMPSSYVLSRTGIINAAKAYVGFSYWWGGAALPNPWDVAGKSHGVCKSSSYSGHSGSWGADCSGYVGDVWQLPEHKSFTTNTHPFNTSSFYYNKTHWSHIDRKNAQLGDALVYRSGSGGHIVIFAGGDPWGASKAYEARGCSYGIVYNTRTFSSSYRARRRSGI